MNVWARRCFRMAYFLAGTGLAYAIIDGDWESALMTGSAGMMALALATLAGDRHQTAPRNV